MNATNMRLQLQTLLDDKEKQLQLTGTLGQRFLQQQMELEQRINQLSEFENAATGGRAAGAGANGRAATGPPPEEVNAEMHAKLQELAETMQRWESENEQLWSGLASKPVTSAPPSARPIQTPITPGSSPRAPPRNLSPPPQPPQLEQVENTNGTAGPSAAQSSRRAKNAAHRANDVEFAFEIGSSLLTEVRRLQALLSERDKTVHDLKEERDDLDKNVDTLRSALRQQEASADKFKEENWNLEVTTQELRNQLADAQSAASRARADLERTNNQLTATRELAETEKGKTEKLASNVEELKVKHETDVAQMKKQAASLARDKSDLQTTLDTLKLDFAKKERQLARLGSPLAPSTVGAAVSTPTADRFDQEDEMFAGVASTRRRGVEASGSAYLTPGGGDIWRAEYDSPDFSPSKPSIVLGPTHPSNELEALKQSLAHAHRQINTLKGTIQREKEQKLDFKRRLAKEGLLNSPAGVPGAWGGDEDEDEDDQDEPEVVDEYVDSKPRSRLLTPSRGRGGSRGARRGGRQLSLAQKLGIAAAERERELLEEEAEDEEGDFNKSTAAMDLLAEHEEEEPEPSPFVVPSAPPSRPTSVGGMDPAFANILRGMPDVSPAAPHDPRSSIHGSSPLKPLTTPAPPPTSPPTTAPRKSRAGAGFLAGGRPASFQTPITSALSAELGNLNGMDSPHSEMLLEEMEIERPEMKEMGTQSDPEPVPEPVIKEVTVIVEKPVEVERIVERIVEVSVEKIVERTVEVPVERIVERIVEVPVEKIVEVKVPFETTVEVPVERVVERIVEVNVPVTVHKDVPVEKIVEVRVEVEKIVERRVEVPVEVEKIVEVKVPVEVERIVEKLVEVPVDRIVEKIVEVPVDRIVEKIVEVQVDRIVEKIVEVPVDRIVEKVVEVPVDRIVEVPVDRIVEVPVDRIVEVPVDRIVEVQVDRIVEVPVDRIVEKIVEKVVEVPTPVTIELPLKEYSSVDIQTDAVEETREIDIDTTPMLNVEIQSLTIDREEIEIPISSSSSNLSPIAFPTSEANGDRSYPIPRTPRSLSANLQRSPRPVGMVFEDPEEDDERPVSAAGHETDTDAEYLDARESVAMGLTPTPSQSLTDFHSAANSMYTASEAGDGSDGQDSDADSIGTSRDALRQSYNSYTVTGRRVSQMSVATSRPHSALKAAVVVASVAPPPAPKPEVKDVSVQTDDWSPPLPAPLPITAPGTPIFRRIGTTSAPLAPPFTFISSPAKDLSFGSAASSTPTNARSASPARPTKTLRDSNATFGGSNSRAHSIARSDRRPSIESAFSNVGDETIVKISPPRGIPTPQPVDRTRPPVMMLPPPPPMPPPATIPVKKTAAPPRPTSPPPIELIQRATTPTFGRSVTPTGLPSSLMVPGASRSYIRQHGSSMPPPSSNSGSHNLRQPSSTSSFRSTPNNFGAALSQKSPVLGNFPEHASMNGRRTDNLSSTTSLLLSGSSHGPSRRPSVSSSRSSEIHMPNTRTPARQSMSGVPAGGAAGNPEAPSDPDVIHAITQTMIGEFLYKYTRRVVGKGHGEKRHRRFFWVHPYTKTLYWSSADPGSSNVTESSAKSAYIESVKSVLDPNPMPPGLYQYSVIVSTPQREMKFTCPTKERHDIWYNALSYLLARPTTVPTQPPTGNDENVEPPPSPTHHRKYSTERGQRDILSSPRSPRSIHSVHSYSITPRAMRSNTQLSHHGSLGKRPGTPAAEYLRWMDDAQSPAKSVRLSRHEDQRDGDDDDVPDPAEESFELAEANEFESMENVRACCDGEHDIGTLSRKPHNHHHHNHPPQNQQQPNHSTVDGRLAPAERPISPSGWSLRSMTGSTHSESGGLFGWAGDAKRSLRFKRGKSPGPSRSKLPMPQNQR